MILGVYSVKDIKSGFTGLMLDQNDQIAVRNFEHAFADKNSVYRTHAKDFSLFRVGKFDTTDGKLETLGVAQYQLLCEGSDAVERV